MKKVFICAVMALVLALSSCSGYSGVMVKEMIGGASKKTGFSSKMSSGGASSKSASSSSASSSSSSSGNSSSSNSSSSNSSSSNSSSSNSSSSNSSSSNSSSGNSSSSSSSSGTSTTTDNYQPPARGGKAMANEEQAVEIAREFLNISKTANYKYNIRLVEDYYVVNFEVYFDDGEKDECGCKVNAKGFYAYDPVG